MIMVILNKDVEIVMPLKYVSNFWTNLLMPLIDCEIDFILICSATDSTGAGTFKVSDTKLYVLVVNLSTQDNLNLLKKLKS